jgi:hypothetical protein
METEGFITSFTAALEPICILTPPLSEKSLS